MLKTFESLKRVVNYKRRGVVTDNFIFKLHYRVTFGFLAACCLIVTSQHYVGDRINCVAEDKKNMKVINSFCFFSSTFTVPGGDAHPGVGPYVQGEDPEKHHAYYQWVPFVLFLQALAFYAPHYMWRVLEGGRMTLLVQYLEHSYLSLTEANLKIGEDVIPTRSEKSHRLQIIRNVFFQRLYILKVWAVDLILCEILNAVLLVCQILFTHHFVGSRSDLTFPKMTKCNFHKYGSSGTIQLYDALCVLPLNLFHERIFLFLWYWYMVLSVMTAAGLLWRLVTFILHSRSIRFNKIAFAIIHPNLSHVWELVTLTGENHYSDWLFLYYLAKNLGPLVFQELFLITAAEIEV